MKLFTGIVFVKVLTCCFGSMYYSLHRMERVLNSESIMIEKLQHYVDTATSSDDLNVISGFLIAARMAHQASENDRYYMTNPINIFVTIRRLAIDWNAMMVKYFNDGVEIVDMNECTDENDNCPLWKENGECERTAGYMRQYCRKSCEICKEGQEGRRCEDNNENCDFWANTDECTKNPAYMLKECRYSCKVCFKSPEPSKEVLESPKGQVLQAYRNLKLYGDPGPWPLQKDVNGVSVGLLRLCLTYNLDVEELIAGRILGVQTEALTTRQTYDLAHGMFLSGEMYGTWLFLKPVIRRLKDIQGHESENLKWRTAAEELAQALSAIQLPHYSIQTLEYYLTHDETSSRADVQPLLERYEKELQVLSEADENYANNTHPARKAHNLETYEQLCRGESLKTPEEESQLYCRYRPSAIPFLPTKEEIANLEPRIVLFHDVIGKAEMARVRTVANDSLTESTVAGTGGTLRFSTQRVSMSAFLFEDADTLMSKLNQRVTQITGLSTREKPSPMHVEALQVLNYGIGGMYEPHHDYFHGSTKNNFMLEDCGDRVSTFMFYLSGVQLGGSTVFPNARTAVSATEGGAAFWYNLDPYGQPDPRTLHAGCPVLIGSKWVANKWTREVGQTFTRRCPTEPPAYTNSQAEPPANPQA